MTEEEAVQGLFQKLKLLQHNFALHVSIKAKLQHSMCKSDLSLNMPGARQTSAHFSTPHSSSSSCSPISQCWAADRWRGEVFHYQA